MDSFLDSAMSLTTGSVNRTRPGTAGVRGERIGANGLQRADSSQSSQEQQSADLTILERMQRALVAKHEAQLKDLTQLCDTQDAALQTLSEQFAAGEVPDDWQMPGTDQQQATTASEESESDSEEDEESKRWAEEEQKRVLHSLRRYRKQKATARVVRKKRNAVVIGIFVLVCGACNPSASVSRC